MYKRRVRKIWNTVCVQRVKLSVVYEFQSSIIVPARFCLTSFGGYPDPLCCLKFCVQWPISTCMSSFPPAAPPSLDSISVIALGLLGSKHTGLPGAAEYSEANGTFHRALRFLSLHLRSILLNWTGQSLHLGISSDIS